MEYNVGVEIKKLFIVYSCGHIVRIAPEPKFEKCYYDILESIYSVTSIISDGKKIDLTDEESVRSITVQRYSAPENDYYLSSSGTLEKLLMEKANRCSKPIQSKLAIAYLRKAAELMKMSDVEWDRREFQRVAWKLQEFGAEEDAVQLENWYKANVLTDEQKAELIFSGKLNKKLENIHKEILTVKRVTTEDMMQFPSISYQLNCPIKNHIEHGSHPSAYMDLNQFNQNVARNDLSYLGELVKKSTWYSPRYALDVTKIAFEEYSPGYGYTKLICTPRTFSGKLSKFPLSLSFMSRMDIHSFHEHGSITYLKDGSIGKAEVHIGRRESWDKPGVSRSFYFKIIDGELALYKTE